MFLFCFVIFSQILCKYLLSILEASIYLQGAGDFINALLLRTQQASEQMLIVGGGLFLGLEGAMVGVVREGGLTNAEGAR